MLYVEYKRKVFYHTFKQKTRNHNKGVIHEVICVTPYFYRMEEWYVAK